MTIKKVLNDKDVKFQCEQLFKTVSANYCFNECGEDKGECQVPRGMRLALIRNNLSYTPYFKKKNDDVVHFRVHSLIGSPCVRKLVLDVLKPLKSYPTIDGLNIMGRGNKVHDMFKSGFECHSVELIYEEEYEGVKFAIHGEIDFYDTFIRQIVDLKTTEWMPSYSNTHAKARDIEQVQIYDGLNLKGKVVKYYDENNIKYNDLGDDTKLDVDSLRLVYYNMGGSSGKNVGNYFESYDIKRDLQLFDSRLTIIREAVGFIAESREMKVCRVPVMGRRKCAGCNYKGVYC